MQVTGELARSPAGNLGLMGTSILARSAKCRQRRAWLQQSTQIASISASNLGLPGNNILSLNATSDVLIQHDAGLLDTCTKHNGALQEKDFAAERAKLDDASPKQRLAAVKARKAGVVDTSVFDQLDVNGEAAHAHADGFCSCIDSTGLLLSPTVLRLVGQTV